MALAFHILMSLVAMAAAVPGPSILSVKAMAPFESKAGSLGDGSDSTLVGTNVLWMSGDTATAAGFLSATAAWSTLAEPWVLHEESRPISSTDPRLVPLQFIPYTQKELDFNNFHINNISECCKSTSNCSDSNKYCNCPARTCPIEWPLSII